MNEDQSNPAPHDPIKDLGPGHRSFFIKVEQINISWHWKKNNKHPTATINGNAKSEKDGVRASDSKKIHKEFKFTITGQDDAGIVWQKEKEMRNSIRRIISFRYNKSTMDAIAVFDRAKDDYFNLESPTARLNILDADREFNFEGGVFLDCFVPDFIFQKILQDFSEKKSSVIRVAISWAFEFVEDPNAPINFPTNWVLLKHTTDSSLEPLMGYVEELNWW